MFRKKLMAVMAVAVFGMSLASGNGYVFAHEAHEHEVEGSQAAVKAEVCPVSGEEIENKTDFSYEHKGKVYSLCCADCLRAFKEDPEKYIGGDVAQGPEEMPHEGHDHE